MNVTVRDLTANDIPLILNYWYSSDSSFLESMGVDLSKLVAKEDFRKMLEDKCQANDSLSESKLNAQVICVDGKPIGFHTINPLTEGDHGIFHAHIWDDSMRGKGVGMKSYPLACKTFMERFDLKKILFKTPTQNTGAIRVKEKLNIPYIGEEEISFGIYKEGTKALVFQLDKDATWTD